LLVFYQGQEVPASALSIDFSPADLSLSAVAPPPCKEKIVQHCRDENIIILVLYFSPEDLTFMKNTDYTFRSGKNYGNLYNISAT